MRKQFDSCSYAELTSCVRYRIQRIREFKKFLSDDISKAYASVRVAISMKVLIYELEIRKLLKMRRVLKKSSLKNWDTERIERLGFWK